MHYWQWTKQHSNKERICGWVGRAQVFQLEALGFKSPTVATEVFLSITDFLVLLFFAVQHWWGWTKEQSEKGFVAKWGEYSFYLLNYSDEYF